MMTAYYDTSNEPIPFYKTCGNVTVKWQGGEEIEIIKGNNRSIVLTIDAFEDLMHLANQLGTKIYNKEVILAELPEI